MMVQSIVNIVGFNFQGTRIWNISFRGSTTQKNTCKIMMTFIYSYQWYSSDPIKWRWTSDGQFSIKSFHRFLNCQSKPYPFTSIIIHLPIPSTVRILLQLVVKKRINTADVLRNKNISHNPTCVLCEQSVETNFHLFVSYPFTIFFWKFIKLLWHIVDYPASLID